MLPFDDLLSSSSYILQARQANLTINKHTVLRINTHTAICAAQCIV
jgi:hypothetical protein